MARLHLRLWIATAALFLAIGSVSAAGQDPDPKLENKGTPITVLGYVRDIGCLMRHPDVLKPTNDCAIMCAKAGSPLVVAAKDGTLYLTISPTIPDSSQHARLMPYVGKYVRARGRVFERAGIKAIAIDQIENAADPPQTATR
jgi:hypothetical protein